MIQDALDWGNLAPLRLLARSVADGAYAGMHRSLRRGSGVEFGGHRSYVRGDDLRFIDHRAYLRHGRLLIREFETETDRGLRLIVDASRSMGFRSERAPGAKLAYAAVLAAALARIAVASGDPVALDWLGGTECRSLPAAGGREAFERIVAALQLVAPGGELQADVGAVGRAFAPVARHARRGAIVVLFSDFIDLPPGTHDQFAALGTHGRQLIAVRVLDPVEHELPFTGPLRLRASEGGHVVETDPSAVRARYLAALEEIAQRWRERLVPRGGELVRAVTSDDAVSVVRAILVATRGGAT